VGARHAHHNKHAHGNRHCAVAREKASPFIHNMHARTCTHTLHSVARGDERAAAALATSENVCVFSCTTLSWLLFLGTASWLLCVYDKKKTPRARGGSQWRLASSCWSWRRLTRPRRKTLNVSALTARTRVQRRYDCTPERPPGASPGMACTMHKAASA